MAELDPRPLVQFQLEESPLQAEYKHPIWKGPWRMPQVPAIGEAIESDGIEYEVRVVLWTPADRACDVLVIARRS